MRRRQMYALQSEPKPMFAEAIEAIPTEQKFYDDMDDGDLKAAFEAVIGHKPHWKMKRETMLEKLHDACDYSA